MALRVRAELPDGAGPEPWRLFWVGACGLVGVAVWCAVRSLRAEPSQVLPHVIELAAQGVELAFLFVWLRPSSPRGLARAAFGGVKLVFLLAIALLIEAARGMSGWERAQIVLHFEWLGLAAVWLLIVAAVALVAGPDEP